MNSDPIKDALYTIVRCLHTARRLTGLAKVSIQTTGRRDSDGASLYEVTAMPLENTHGVSGKSSIDSRNKVHLIFLDTDIPVQMLGRQFIVQVFPKKDRNGQESDFPNIKVDWQHQDICFSSVFEKRCLQDLELKYKDLSESLLGNSQFRGIDLQGTSFRQVDLSKSDLSLSDMTLANFQDANLSDCQMEHSQLSAASFENAILKNANLQGSVLKGAYFNKCNMENINLFDTIMTGTQLIDCYLQGANLSGTSMFQATLKNVNLKRANLSNTDLQECSMIEVDLSGADLSHACFGASFYLMAEAPKAETIDRNIFAHAILKKTECIETDLSHTNFQGADLRHSIFQRSNLQFANLQKADLSHSNLEDANLENAQIEETNFFEAHYNQGTIFPKGFSPEEHLMVFEQAQAMTPQKPPLG